MITKEDILTELKMASIDNANFIDGKLSWDYVSADTYAALKPTQEEEYILIDKTLEQFAKYYEAV